MPHTDRLGLPLTTSSDAAAAAYRTGIDLLLATWTGAAEELDAAIAADPEFALAHAARARLHFIRAEGQAAKAAIARAVACAALNATERERSHVAILALTMSGQPAQALSHACAHLDRWPRDSVILSLPLGAFGLYAFSGMSGHNQARVDLCERHASAYGDDWWFNTYLGWSLTENGDVVRGRRLTERALELRRENANALHALAHALFEDGSSAAADALIAEWLPLYDRSAILYSHINWHRALIALERGDIEQALAIYTGHIQPGATEALPINVVTDSASFLWRTKIYGHAVPPQLWSGVTAYTEAKFPAAGVTFVDVHAAMAAAAANAPEAFAARLDTLDQKLGAGTLAAGPVVPAICRALQAYSDEDFVACVRTLEPVVAEVVRIGGSHAQREIVEDTLLVALMKSGQSAKAKAMLDQRLHRRPSQRDTRWRTALAEQNRTV